METDELIGALRMVPETHLCLIALAWEVTAEDGALDLGKLAFHAKELAEAIDEARAYAEETQELTRCLVELAHSRS